MCLAVPGKIIDIFGTLARVRIMGVDTTANIQLIENPRISDYVLVHAGCAIEKIDGEYFDDLVNLYKNTLNEDIENG